MLAHGESFAWANADAGFTYPGDSLGLVLPVVLIALSPGDTVGWLRYTSSSGAAFSFTPMEAALDSTGRYRPATVAGITLSAGTGRPWAP